MKQKCNLCSYNKIYKFSGFLLIFLTFIISIIIVNKFYKYK